MTNQPIDFSQPYSGGWGGHIYGSALTTSAGDDFQRPTWRQLQSPDPKKYRIMECTIWEQRNGYQDRGGLIGTESSTLDQRYGLTLPPLIGTTDISSSANVTAIHFTHFGQNKTFVFALQDATANKVLYLETAFDDPTPAAVTYDPGAGQDIISLAPIIIGGASSVERLAIGRLGAVTDVHTTVGTSDGTMHASTTSMWGLQTSNINASAPGTGTLMIMAGTATASLYTLSQTAAINAAPTAILTNMPSGGADLGVVQLQKNWPVRAYWMLPFQSVSGMWFGGSTIPGYVMSTNLEASDPQLIPTNLSRAYYGCLWNRTVTQSDGLRVVSYDGETERDLHFLKNRPIDTNFRWGCTGLIPHGGELYAFVQRSDLTSSLANTSAGSSTLAIERYIPEFDAWVPTTGTFTLASSGNTKSTTRAATFGYDYVVKTNAPFYVVSRQTSFVHFKRRDTTFSRAFLSPEGVEPFRHYNGSGALAKGFATSGTFTSNEFPVPGAGRNPTVLYEIDATQMDVAAGGTDSKVEVEWASQSSTGQSWSFDSNLAAEFKGSDPQAKMFKNFWQNTSPFTLGKFRINATQGATTTKTGTYLPVTFRFITYLEGKVDKPPIAVLGGLPK